MEALGRLRLARAAAALNARSGTKLPPLVLMTDDERLPDPLAAARAIPQGSMVVVRARQASHRAKLAQALRPIVRSRKLVLLIANDPPLADRVRAAGVHFSEERVKQAGSWRIRRPNWLITAAAHSLAACATARRSGADAVFLSPLLPTRSHPGSPCLGLTRAKVIARLAPVPSYALGGVQADSARRLAASAFVGLAGIGALAA